MHVSIWKMKLRVFLFNPTGMEGIMYLYCLMALKIKEDINLFVLGAKFPIEIGCNVKPCPKCGAPLSFAYDQYFCRVCNYDQSTHYSDA